jgi:hypothetical protein
LHDTLEDCAAALDRARYRVLVRIFDAELREAVQKKLPSCVVDSSGLFADAVRRARCVIGTSSSVLLEAMRLGRPTGQLIFRDSPLFYQSGWLLGCNTNWTESFSAMVAGNPDRMSRQRRTLEENLSDTDFYSLCREVAEGRMLESPRPIDLADAEFENELFRAILGWRATLFAPLLRLVYSRRRRNGALPQTDADPRSG